MNTPTVQSLFQKHIESYCDDHRLDGQRIKVCRHLMECHTAALGGLQYECDHCEATTVQYHSCRDRQVTCMDALMSRMQDALERHHVVNKERRINGVKGKNNHCFQ